MSNLFFIHFLLGKLNILYLHVHTHGYLTSFRQSGSSRSQIRSEEKIWSGQVMSARQMDGCKDTISRRSRVSGAQSGVTKSKGVYTCVTVPIYKWCSALMRLYPMYRLFLVISPHQLFITDMTYNIIVQYMYYKIFYDFLHLHSFRQQEFQTSLSLQTLSTVEHRDSVRHVYSVDLLRHDLDQNFFGLSYLYSTDIPLPAKI